MSDNIEGMQSRFYRYMLEKTERAGRVPSFVEFCAEYEAFMEQYDSDDDDE